MAPTWLMVVIISPFARFEKRHKNISVHLSPCFRDTAIGDTLTVVECTLHILKDKRSNHRCRLISVPFTTTKFPILL